MQSRISRPLRRGLSSTWVPVLIGIALLTLLACNQPPPSTPTPIPSPTPFLTPTPTQSQQILTAVRSVFDAQVAAIKLGDWETAYVHCSPGYRQLRDAERFAQDASSQFERDGYRSDGFEARNVQVSVRSPDRVTVSYDAYQDGQFIRTHSVGQNYTLVNGRWWDEGTWCKLRVGA